MTIWLNITGVVESARPRSLHSLVKQQVLLFRLVIYPKSVGVESLILLPNEVTSLAFSASEVFCGQIFPSDVQSSAYRRSTTFSIEIKDTHFFFEYLCPRSLIPVQQTYIRIRCLHRESVTSFILALSGG